MERYASILLIAMPMFLVLVTIESLYGYYIKKEPFRLFDTISSLSSGFTNSLKDVLGLGISIITYDWLYRNFAIFNIESTLIVYIIAFIAIDLAGYIGHRLDHHVSFFWNGHLIHHSSQEFNLACALRQSIARIINIFTIFLLPAAILGVPTEVIAVVAPIQLFSQFWYHTRYIKKLGFLEHVLVTPSHHRVHHAINEEYLDKNLSQVFIVWDKLFGTFQEEREDIPPVYGITVPVTTWNPIKINFVHFWHILKDSWRTSNWADKLKVWYKPPAFRPKDMQEKYPLEKPEDIYNLEKYDTKLNKASRIFVVFEYLFTTFMIVLLYVNIAKLSTLGMLVFGAFIFFSIYAYSEFMDKKNDAKYFLLAKSIFGLILVLNTKLLEPIFENSPQLMTITVLYLAISSILGFVLSKSFSETETIEKELQF